MRLTPTPARMALLAVFAAGGCLAGTAPPKGEVTVVVDLTAAGRQVAPPSPGHPVYYVPVVLGYREQGGQIAGEPPPPPPEAVARQLGQTLARQGYYVVGPKTGDPSVLLMFSWGCWNPVVEVLPPEDPANPDNFVATSTLPRPTPDSVVRNADEMIVLVAGNTLRNTPVMPSYMTDFKREAVETDALDNRYFAVVAAFDWAAAQQHKHVLLWSAKMSIRSNGTSFGEIFPALIASGGPFFGRETRERQQVTVPLVREGRIDLGELQIKDVVDDPKPAPAATEKKAPDAGHGP